VVVGGAGVVVGGAGVVVGGAGVVVGGARVVVAGAGAVVVACDTVAGGAGARLADGIGGTGPSGERQVMEVERSQLTRFLVVTMAPRRFR
jgi:hypothetical protein